MVTGLAAAGGAAVGSMITNSMYDNNNQYLYGYAGVPYGHPIYKEPNGQYYYANQNGYHVPITPNNTTAPVFDQYSQQAATGFANQSQQRTVTQEATGCHGQSSTVTQSQSQQKEGRLGRRHRGDQSSTAIDSDRLQTRDSSQKAGELKSRFADRNRRF